MECPDICEQSYEHVPGDVTAALRGVLGFGETEPMAWLRLSFFHWSRLRQPNVLETDKKECIAVLLDRPASQCESMINVIPSSQFLCRRVCLLSLMFLSARD
jgi:hypothetical protein